MGQSSLGSHTSGSMYLYSAERERERKQNWWGEGLSIAARDLKGWILPQQHQKSPVKLYKCHFYKYFKAQHDIWEDCSYFCFKFCEKFTLYRKFITWRWKKRYWWVNFSHSDRKGLNSLFIFHSEARDKMAAGLTVMYEHLSEGKSTVLILRI